MAPSHDPATGLAGDSAHSAWNIDPAGVATLTIRNAGVLNILSSPVIVDLTRVIAALGGRDNVRVLVLRGSGERAFIGGADIREMVTLDPPGARAFITRLKDLCEAVRRFPSPTIARLAGHALGGGLEVALACDLRIADDGAHFGMPEVAVGIPSVIHAALLPRLIGSSRATWMLLTGESIDAATALSWGLVQEVCAPGTLDTCIAARAARLASFGPAALRQQKTLLRAWESSPIDAAIDATVAEFGQAFATGEPQQHMQSFLRRRR